MAPEGHHLGWTDAASGKGGGGMVTYEYLLTYTLVVIAIITLVLDICNRSK